MDELEITPADVKARLDREKNYFSWMYGNHGNTRFAESKEQNWSRWDR